MGTPSLNLPNFSPDDNTESSGRAGCPVKLFFPPADNFRLDLGTGGAICLYRLPGLNLPADFYLHLFGVLSMTTESTCSMPGLNTKLLSTK